MKIFKSDMKIRVGEGINCFPLLKHYCIPHVTYFFPNIIKRIIINDYGKIFRRSIFYGRALLRLPTASLAKSLLRKSLILIFPATLRPQSRVKLFTLKRAQFVTNYTTKNCAPDSIAAVNTPLTRG